MPLDIRIAHPSDLSEGEIGAWWDLHRAFPALRSPFFSPHLARLAGLTRPSARVGILRSAHAIKGFFPFQARRGGLGIGLIGPLTDYQGLVGPADLDVDARALVRACGLTVLDFENVPAEQAALRPFQELTDVSHVIDLRIGYDAYIAAMNTPNTKVFSDTAAKDRRLSRRVGPLRFVAHDTDPKALDTLIAWKRQQYAASTAIDSLAWPWTRELIRRIYAAQTPDFAGMLSTLYAGDTLIAAHFGMRSGTVLHYWFPAYDAAHAKLSPGMVLLLRLIAHAAESGLDAIDLGAGDYEFKLRLANSGIAIAEGTVVTPAVNAAFASRVLSRLAENAFEAMPLGRLSSVPRRGFRKLRSYLAFI